MRLKQNRIAIDCFTYEYLWSTLSPLLIFNSVITERQQDRKLPQVKLKAEPIITAGVNSSTVISDTIM